jgi:hypothetical protein
MRRDTTLMRISVQVGQALKKGVCWPNNTYKKSNNRETKLSMLRDLQSPQQDRLPRILLSGSLHVAANSWTCKISRFPIQLKLGLYKSGSFHPTSPRDKNRCTSSRPDAVLVAPISAKTKKQQTSNEGGSILSRNGRGH